MAKRNSIVLETSAPAEITLSTPHRKPIEFEVIGGNIDRDEYPGPYTVTPTREDQTLNTRNKLMADNVTVFEIPYSEVSNLVGGKTAIIGGI